MIESNKAKDVRPSPGNSRILSGVRIARISTVPFFVLFQLKNQIEALSSAGAQVTVITSSGPGFASLSALAGVTCEQVEISRSISPWRDFLALLRLIRLFKRGRIDVTHSTTPKAGLLTAIAAFLAGVPVRLHTFTGQPWVNMKGPIRWLARWSDRFIGKLNTRCYTDSGSQRQFLIDQGIFPASRLFVIGAGSLAGVNLKRFNSARFTAEDQLAIRQSLGIREAAPVLLFVGRIMADKGVRELIDAFRELKAAGGAAYLILVGPFDLESGGGGEISRHDIDNIQDVHIVGYTENPESYMAIADILCLPSYREGFGTVVIEAAAMGVPTVGSDIYGLSDAVVNGETGILVPPRDVTALKLALAVLLEDKTARQNMGGAAKRRAEIYFDADQVNLKLIEEYRNLLTCKRAH